MRTPTISSRPASATKKPPALEPEATLEVDHDDEPRASIPTWLRETPYWAVSAVLHLLLFAVLLSIITQGPRKEEEPVVMNVTMEREKKPPPYDPDRNRHIDRTESPLLVETTARVFNPVVNQPNIEFPEDLSPPDTEINTTLRLPIIGPGDHRIPGLISARPIGPGGLPGGDPSGRTENAVRAALEWLTRHQSPDGSWKSHDFTDTCTDTCRCLDPARHGDGRGFANHDVGVTGLADNSSVSGGNDLSNFIANTVLATGTILP